jgi:hypothetical protein
MNDEKDGMIMAEPDQKIFRYCTFSPGAFTSNPMNFSREEVSYRRNAQLVLLYVI